MLFKMFMQRKEQSLIRKLAITWMPWIVCTLAATFYCYEYLLRIMPSVMVTDLMKTYGISAAAFGHLSAFYYYAYTPMQLPVGLLFDKFRAKYILTFACFVCAFGAYLFAATDNLAIASVGRFLVGFGSAFAFVGVLKLATIWLPPDRFAMVAGLTTTLGMLGAMFGTIILTDLVQTIGWTNTSNYAAIAGLILMVFIFMLVSNKPSAEPKIKTENLATTKALIKGFGKIIFNYQIWIAGLIGAVLYMSLSVFAELWGIPYLRYAHHFSEAAAAKCVSMVFLGWTIGGPLAGWFSDRIKKRKSPMIIGTFIALISISAVLFMKDLSPITIYILLFLYGLFCSAEVIVFAVGRENSPSLLAGTAVAVTNMLVMFGGVVMQPMVGNLLDWYWSGKMVDSLPFYSVNEYQIALSILPISLVVALVLFLFMKETNAKLTD